MRAHDLSNVRAFPYNLTTSFVVSTGSSANDIWTLQNIANGHAYRLGGGTGTELLGSRSDRPAALPMKNGGYETPNTG